MTIIARFLGTISALLLVSASATAAMGKGNQYEITFSNQSEDTYYLFVEGRKGSDPILLKQGKQSKLTVKATSTVYIASTYGLQKLITQQTYPLPGVVLSQEEEGFTSQDYFENGTQILVTFEDDDVVTLKNTGKPLFPPVKPQ